MPGIGPATAAAIAEALAAASSRRAGKVVAVNTATGEIIEEGA